MSKVDLSVIGTRTKPIVFEYTWRDVVLYNIGVGAAEKDLAFVYENAPGGLKVLPSFCVVPAMKAFPHLGDNLEWSLMLHGEQVIRLSQPLAPEGKIIQVGEVLNIYDKGKGAVYRIRITGRTEDERDLYEAEWSIFYVGAGGFGGDPGPKAERIVPPEGIEPYFSISEKVAENQAAIYRLSGDLNPLHLDPEAAQRGGFDRPILHGLCTYGIATRAVVNELLGGNVSRLKEFRARFSDVVYPGDTLTTEGWKSGDGYIIQARTDRSVVLNNARVVIEWAPIDGGHGRPLPYDSWEVALVFVPEITMDAGVTYFHMNNIETNLKRYPDTECLLNNFFTRFNYGELRPGLEKCLVSYEMSLGQPERPRTIGTSVNK